MQYMGRQQEAANGKCKWFEEKKITWITPQGFGYKPALDFCIKLTQNVGMISLLLFLSLFHLRAHAHQFG